MLLELYLIKGFVLLDVNNLPEYHSFKSVSLSLSLSLTFSYSILSSPFLFQIFFPFEKPLPAQHSCEMLKLTWYVNELGELFQFGQLYKRLSLPDFVPFRTVYRGERAFLQNVYLRCLICVHPWNFFHNTSFRRISSECSNGSAR